MTSLRLSEPPMRHEAPVFIYLSARCNYECSYCFTESGPHSSSESFVLTNWLALIDQAPFVST